MAVIRIDEDRLWGGAKWVLGYVIRNLNVPDSCPELKQRLFLALEDGTNHLTLSGLSLQERTLLRDEVARITQDLVSTGPKAIASPEHYNGLLAKVVELNDMMQEDVVK